MKRDHETHLDPAHAEGEAVGANKTGGWTRLAYAIMETHFMSANPEGVATGAANANDWTLRVKDIPEEKLKGMHLGPLESRIMKVWRDKDYVGLKNEELAARVNSIYGSTVAVKSQLKRRLGALLGIENKTLKPALPVEPRAGIEEPAILAEPQPAAVIARTPRETDIPEKLLNGTPSISEMIGFDNATGGKALVTLNGKEPDLGDDKWQQYYRKRAGLEGAPAMGEAMNKSAEIVSGGPDSPSVRAVMKLVSDAVYRNQPGGLDPAQKAARRLAYIGEMNRLGGNKIFYQTLTPDRARELNLYSLRNLPDEVVEGLTLDTFEASLVRACKTLESKCMVPDNHLLAQAIKVETKAVTAVKAGMIDDCVENIRNKLVQYAYRHSRQPGPGGAQR